MTFQKGMPFIDLYTRYFEKSNGSIQQSCVAQATGELGPSRRETKGTFTSVGHTVRLLGKKKKEGRKIGGASLDLPKIRKNPLIEIIAINTG